MNDVATPVEADRDTIVDRFFEKVGELGVKPALYHKVGDSWESLSWTEYGRKCREFAGGLIASGWHTAAMSMRLLVDCLLGDAATIAARGVDELRWRRPVQPGDRLSVRAAVEDREVDDENRGTVRLRIETTNENDEVVFSMIGIVLFARRQE